jgi:hypothetical protein
MSLFGQVWLDLIEAIGIRQHMLQAIVPLTTGEAIHAHVIAHSRECTRDARGPDVSAGAGRKDPKAADQKNLGRCHVAKVVNIRTGEYRSCR